MKHLPKDPSFSLKASDEETVELEAALEDGVYRIDRPHVLPASESGIGGVEHDERGHADWKWKAAIAGPADPNAETLDHLKALDTNLELEQSQKVRVLEVSTKTGMNPYATGRLKKPQ